MALAFGTAEKHSGRSDVTPGRLGKHAACLESLYKQPEWKTHALLADEAIKNFNTTNEYRDEHLSLRDILVGKLPEHIEWSTIYQHGDTKYLVDMSRWEGPDKPWLKIKLPSKGFEFEQTAGQTADKKSSRDQGAPWVSLPVPELSEYFPGVYDATKEMLGQASVVYDYQHHRLGLRLVSNVREALPVEINIENGNPYTDDEDVPEDLE